MVRSVAAMTYHVRREIVFVSMDAIKLWLISHLMGLLVHRNGHCHGGHLQVIS